VTAPTLITREPCFACDDNVMEEDTGYKYCRATQHGGPDDCPTWQAVRELEAKAVASAEHWQAKVRHTPADVKHDAIEAEAGVYEEWAFALGAEFDAEAWVGRCGEVGVLV
jgi:hypothetical protein